MSGFSWFCNSFCMRYWQNSFLNTFGCETISFCRVSGCYVHKSTSFPQTRNIGMRNRPKRQVLVSMAHHFVLHVFWDMSCKSMVLVSVADHLFLIQIWMSSNQRPYLWHLFPAPKTNNFAPWKSMVGSNENSFWGLAYRDKQLGFRGCNWSSPPSLAEERWYS